MTILLWICSNRGLPATIGCALFWLFIAARLSALDVTIFCFSRKCDYIPCYRSGGPYSPSPEANSRLAAETTLKLPKPLGVLGSTRPNAAMLLSPNPIDRALPGTT